MTHKLELERLLHMTEHEVIFHAAAVLSKHYEVITDYDNYLVVQGDSPICLVAHVDTVSFGTLNMVLKWNRNVIRNTEGILGADDRAGVFAILEIVESAKKSGLPMPSVIFTNYEESGGRGVKELIKSKVFDTSNTKLFVELDRKGSNEYVYYTSSLPREVKDYVESFGYIQKDGSYSDIMDLAFEYHIPAVNLSIGYYSQHTQFETLHYDEMFLNINRVKDMLKDPITQLYKLSDADCISWMGYGGYSDYYGTYKCKKPEGKVIDMRNHSTQDKEWPSSASEWNLGEDDGWPVSDFEDPSEQKHSLEFAEMLKCEIYCSIQDETIHDMYSTYIENTEVLAFMDNFFDFFAHEQYKRGFLEHELMPEEEFEEVFEVVWNIVSHVYGESIGMKF